MRRRHGKVNRWVLVSLACVAVGGFWLEARSARRQRAPGYDVKLASSRLAARAFDIVRQYRDSLGVPVDTVNDPNASGLIGVQYSQLTYGRSDLSDALTTLNPNFAAVLLEMLVRAGVRPGDTVGVSWDGTYPALNIALLAVAACYPFEPLLVTAQTAGMWGANYPGLTWLDIEALLRHHGLWQYRTAFATLGGEADDGRGLSPAGREAMAATAAAAGVDLFVPGSLEEAVRRRVAAFGRPRAFVSVGRVAADMGDPGARIPSRVIARPTPRVSSGVIAAMLDAGVPVVYLANPGRVAVDYRLPVAPVPVPEPGDGALFHERRRSVILALVFAAIILALLVVVVRYDVEWYLGVGRHRPDEEAV